MLKGTYSISPKTCECVISAARQLGYNKSGVATPMNPGQGGAYIAVVIPNILNPYYASLVNGLQGALYATGMTMVLYNSRNDKALEQKYTQQLLAGNYAGVVIASLCEEYDHIKLLVDHGIKVLAFEQQIDLNCNRVYFNYKKGGYMAAEYLIRQGKEKIGFVCSPLTRSSRRQVYNGYKKALADHGIEVNSKYTCIADNELTKSNELFDYQNGVEQAQRMIENHTVPEAVFCINDMTAIGVMHTLQANGYHVPNDVAIVGFDNINFASMVSPGLTTIEQSTYELGSVAAEILTGSINDPDRNDISIMLEPKLIVRKSA